MLQWFSCLVGSPTSPHFRKEDMEITSGEIIDEACKELWGVVKCYDAKPQELIGALLSVTAHVCKAFGLTQEQAVHIFSNTWKESN